MADGLIMHALYMRPGEQLVEKILDGSEAEMEDLVDGKIASVGIDDGVCVIYNAFADKLNMPLNRTIYNQPFYGPIIVVAFDAFGQLTSLDEESLPYYKKILSL